MSARDWYAYFLLGIARRAANATNRWISVYPQCPDGSWYVEAATGIHGNPTPSCEGHGPTLAEALAALYHDLTGHDPPPRPSEEEVRAWLDDRVGPMWKSSAVELQRVLRNSSCGDDIHDRMMARAVVEAL